MNHPTVGPLSAEDELISGIRLTAGMDLTLIGVVNGVNFPFLVDTGALISLMKGEFYRGEVKECAVQAMGITGDRLSVTSKAELQVEIAGEMFDLEFHLCEMDLPYHGILGLDSLRKLRVVIDFTVDEIRLAALQTERGRITGAAPSKSDVTCGGVANPHRGWGKRQVVRDEESKGSRGHHHSRGDDRVWSVVMPESVVLEARSESLLGAELRLSRGNRKLSCPEMVYVERRDGNEKDREICVARVVSKVF